MSRHGGGGYHSPRGGYYSPRGSYYARGIGAGGLGAGLALGALTGAVLAAPLAAGYYGGYPYGGYPAPYGYPPPPPVYATPPTIVIPTNSSNVAELIAANPGMSVQFIPTSSGNVSPRQVAASPIYYR